MATALGLATAGALWLLGPLATPAHYAVYHWSGSPAVLFAANLLDFALVWLLCCALLWLAGRSERLRLAVWGAIVFLLPAVALKNWALYSVSTPSHILSRGLWLGGTAGFVLLLGLWRPAFRSALRVTVDLATAVLIFLALTGVTVLGQVLWFGWQARGLNEVRIARPAPSRTVPGTHLPRVIWVVLDELSYQQVYERRFPGLQLPAFDAFAAESSIFTNTVPAGQYTARVLPALMTGLPVEEVRSTAAGRLQLRTGAGTPWQAFDQHRTLFQEALRMGYRTGIAGWYNPYCRLLPDVLDRCFWTYDDPGTTGLVAGKSLPANMLQPLRFLLGTGIVGRALNAWAHTVPFRQQQASLHRTDLERLTAEADRLLQDPDAGFILLHLPVPHQPGIYRRAEGQFTTEPSSYIDNLALADRYLAHLRATLSASGQWDGSTIVLMGDHGWRTPLWRSDPCWTAEDSLACPSPHADPRPVYMVKLAGQQRSARVDTSFPALRTHDLLEALLARRIVSAEDLARWAAKPAQQTARTLLAPPRTEGPALKARTEEPH